MVRNLAILNFILRLIYNTNTKGLSYKFQLVWILLVRDVKYPLHPQEKSPYFAFPLLMINVNFNVTNGYFHDIWCIYYVPKKEIELLIWDERHTWEKVITSRSSASGRLISSLARRYRFGLSLSS